MFKIFTLFLFLASLEQVKCNIFDTQTDHIKYIYIFGGIILVSLIRYLVRYAYPIPIPYSLFAIVIGTGVGMSVQYWEYPPHVKQVAFYVVQHLPNIYLPILIFTTCFCADNNLFMKSISQMLILGIPVALFNTCFCGFLMMFVIGSDWSYLDALVFGALLNGTAYTEVVHYLTKISNQTRHLILLMTGEMIFSNICITFICEVSANNMSGWVVHWYQFVAGFTRTICLGLVGSYFVALLGLYLMRVVSDEPVCLMLVTIFMCYLSYYVMEAFADSGAMGVYFSGMMMGIERMSLPIEMDSFISDMWKIIINTFNAMIFLSIGMVIPWIGQYLELSDYVFVLISYLLANIGRFLSFLIFSPILSRTGNGLTFRNMIICVCGGLKNPISIGVTFFFFDIYDRHKFSVFLIHNVLVYVLFLSINATLFPLLLKLLGFLELSLVRQLNMHYCMNYIYQIREKTIGILKMDRFLSDSNWPMVANATAMEHPYKAQTPDDIDEAQDGFLGFQFSVCSECQKKIPTEPSPKEMKEMIREARLRILKLKKVTFSKQFETGLVSKEGIRILHQAVEMAMDTEKAVIELEGLCKMFDKEDHFHKFLKKRLEHWHKWHDIRHPRQYWRYVCYRILRNTWYKMFMHCITALNLIVAVYHLNGKHGEITDKIIVVSFNFLFLICYLIEFWLNIFGYSWIYICQHGFKSYFRSFWNIIEFIVLVSTFLAFVFGLLSILTFIVMEDSNICAHFVTPFMFMSAIRLLRFITLTNKTYDKAINYLDSRINRHRALAYQLGENYVIAEEDILEHLSYVVDNDKVREILKEQIDRDRLLISKHLCDAERETPRLTAHVKTTFASRVVLHCMKDDIKNLKMSGWLDDVEYEKLLKSLADQFKYVRSLESLPEASPREIFDNIPWLGSDEGLINFLYKNVTIKKFDEGDVIFKEGMVATGVYIVISGVFLLTYTASAEILERMTNTGALPVVDYLSSSQFDEDSTDYILPGNTMGVLSTLTGRPYNCNIITMNHGQVFVLTRDVLVAAMKRDPDPIYGLQSRLWKAISFPVALPIMLEIPSYQSFSPMKMKFIIESALMPDISHYKVFIVNETMEDIVLIEGMLFDLSTNDLYSAPCHIPRAVQKLYLPNSSKVDIVSDVETKIIIVPANNRHDFELIVNDQKTCQMIQYNSSRCLRHSVESQAKEKRVSNEFLEELYR